MNEVAIESFITHCDEMFIAEEGIKEVAGTVKNGAVTAGKAVADKVKKAIEHLLNIIQEISYKIKANFKVYSKLYVNADLLKIGTQNEGKFKVLSSYLNDSVLEILESSKEYSASSKKDPASFNRFTENEKIKHAMNLATKFIEEIDEQMSDVIGKSSNVTYKMTDGTKLFQGLANHMKSLRMDSHSYNLQKMIANQWPPEAFQLYSSIAMKEIQLTSKWVSLCKSILAHSKTKDPNKE